MNKSLNTSRRNERGNTSGRFTQSNNDQNNSVKYERMGPSQLCAMPTTPAKVTIHIKYHNEGI